MKLSREWLSELTKIDCSDKEYADAMTMSGSKVEGYEITGEGISKVVVGKVNKMNRHEDSDHLWVCSVDVGENEDIVIVTGAQNVSEGDLVPVALDGSALPGGVTIKSGKLRGVLSQGMLCSLKELGLDTHDFPYAIEDGIFILQEECKAGEDIASVLKFGDSVIDFEITNNRPDCLSVRGLARESAVTFGTELSLHTPAVRADGEGDIKNYLSIEIADSDLCPRYTGRMVKNIKIEPSPYWMRRRLRASGVRPINNIVDITNYVMLEYGQPMHAFDYACLKGQKIIVRRAKPGEVLKTLDGNDRALREDMLVIADESDPTGVAGVMGGFESEITEKTTTIVFESANFNGTSIRRTSTALGMRTDASSRYEKGLDPLNTLPAIERACELVEMLGAGEVVPGHIDAVAATSESNVIELDVLRINTLLGTDISEEYMVRMLVQLGFSVENSKITVPSWRADVEGYADIAEEVARFYGYDKIEASMFRGVTTQGGYSEKQQFERELGSLCRSMGFYEIMTYSFGSRNAWDKVRIPEGHSLRNAFTILNPLGEDTSVMRTVSLPSMMEILSGNLSHRNMSVKLYELATVYRTVEGEDLASEYPVLTMGAYGDVDFFEMKGYVEALLGSVRMEDVGFKAERENHSYHPGRCAGVYSGDELVGYIGQVHPLVCEEYGMDCEVYAVELDTKVLFSNRAPEPTYEPLPRFPAVMRDIAVVCDSEVPVAELISSINSAGGQYLKGCELFDVYTGAPIPEGKKSVAFSLTLRADDMTLTDEHAEITVKSVLEALKNSHNAVIR